MIKKYPYTTAISSFIERAFFTLNNAFMKGGKLLVCGNGGSAADADHITGELMKSFLLERRLSATERQIFNQLDTKYQLGEKLQKAIPVINLTAHTSLCTAIANDISADMIFAQQVYAYAEENDVLLGISTSGKSQNVLKAGMVAKGKNLKTIGLTGADGRVMNQYFDVLIKVPSQITYEIQEMHLPIYHGLCMMLEAEHFGSANENDKEIRNENEND